MPKHDQFDPSEKYYDGLFDNLKKAEKNGTIDGSNMPKSIAQAEKKTSRAKNWINHVTGKRISAISPKQKAIKFLKEKGPLSLTSTVVVASVIGVTVFMSPAILILQLKQIAGVFNSHLAVSGIRNTIMTKMKTSPLTEGFCGSKITIRCKYSTLSEDQVAKFKKLGVGVIAEEGEIAGGRIRPKEFVFDGKNISAKNFNSELKTNAKLRLLIDNSVEFSSMNGTAWEKTKLSKAAVDIGDEGDSDSKRLKKVQEEVNTEKAKGSAHVDGDQVDSEGKKIPGDKEPLADGTYSQSKASEFNQVASKAASEAEEATSGATKSVAKKAITETALSTSKSAIQVVSVVGVIDVACGAYLLIKAIAFTAKTVRAAALEKFAMIYLNIADQIKAGAAKASDVSYLGKTLTTLTVEEDAASGSKVLKSATDSFGYKYMAFGEIGKMTTSTSRFLAGGGMVGKLNDLTNTIKQAVPGNIDATCLFIANPFVQVGALAIGALAFVGSANPFTTGIFTPINVAKVAGVVSLAALTIFLPGMVKDAVAGVVVDDTTVGEDAGDAFVSGVGGIYASIAQYGGSAPMTPGQAAEFNDLKKEARAQDAENDRLVYSPLDPTNNNTFMGKLFSFSVPYISKLSTMSTAFTSIGSFITKSFGLLSFQTANATDSEEAYTMCQDLEYEKIGVATDPFCNVSYGLSKKLLYSADPIQVADKLLATIDPVTKQNRPLINEESGDPIDVYDDFVDNCINREDPLVASIYSVGDPTGREELVTGEVGASECMFNESSDTQDFPTTWSACGTEPAPNPDKGFVYLNKSSAEVIGVGDCPTMKRHYYYIGNAYFYLHYVDQLVEADMGSFSAGTSSSDNNGKFTSPLKTWDKVAKDNVYPNGIPTGQCSDHGDVDLCADYNYKISKPGHGTYSAMGDAVDIAGAANEDVFATSAGQVISVRSDAHSAMLVEIKGKDGNKEIITLYSHINIDSSIKEGVEVREDQKIGTLSSTYSIPHVHFEMKYDGKFIKAGDIASYMK